MHISLMTLCKQMQAEKHLFPSVYHRIYAWNYDNAYIIKVRSFLGSLTFAFKKIMFFSFDFYDTN